MSSLTNYYEAVLLTLESEVSELREVRAYRDEFSDGDIGTISVGLPGALVAMDIPTLETRLSGELLAEVNVAIAVITRETSRAISDMQAMAIAEKIAGVLHQNRFGGAAKTDPASLGINNDNSDKTRKRGISLWTVSYVQGIHLSDPVSIVVPELEFVTDAGLDPETAITTFGPLDSEIGNAGS
jgi:hypothetical protein